MRFGLLVLLTTTGIPWTGCLQSIINPPGGTACTTLFAYGVSVGLTDVNSGNAIAAKLTLTDGDYSETMQTFPSGDYVGAGERAGTYTLTIEATGYLSKTVENIVVTADECHVKGVRLDLKLEPAS